MTHGHDSTCASHVLDECDQQNGGCDQLCRNVPGARRCDCRKGFQLLPDKTRSFKIDFLSFQILFHCRVYNTIQEEVLFQYIDKIVKAEANSVSKLLASWRLMSLPNNVMVVGTVAEPMLKLKKYENFKNSNFYA